MISWPFTNNSIWPIGLDIGHYSINMVQLAGNDAGIHVLAAEKTRIEPSVCEDSEQRNSFIVCSVKQMLERGKFSGRKVISSIANEQIHITSLRMASMDESSESDPNTPH